MNKGEVKTKLKIISMLKIMIFQLTRQIFH
jgi:hypothetical protein